MAEPIGIISGLAGLATVTLNSSVALYDTINSYQSHQQRVLDLAEEAGALSGVLGKLNETVRAPPPNTDLSALDIPLQRCNRACKEFADKIRRCSARSSDSHTSVRDWAKLRYMGLDIDGFRRLLASYTATINIALTDASLRQNTTTAESIEGHTRLLKTTRAYLEERLDIIVEKLEEIDEKVSGPAPDSPEVKQIKEEKLSTEKSLEICAQLAEHISQLQVAARGSARSENGSDGSSVPERITREGLDECKHSLLRMCEKLRRHEKQLFDHLTDRMRASSTSEDQAEEIKQLRDEWESTRESMKILETAGSYVGSSTSVIENRAKGDAIQVMVSTNGKVLHGTNQGDGWRTRQVGGYMDDETVRQLSRDMLRSSMQVAEEQQAEEEGQQSASSRPSETSESPVKQPRDERQSEFMERYGGGFKLAVKPVGSKTGANEAEAEEAQEGSEGRGPARGQR